MESTAPMTPSEAARAIGVSIQTIRLWADSGRLPVTRTAGGMRLFDPAVVERVAREREDARRG